MCVEKTKLDGVIRFLCPNGTGNWDYKSLVRLIDGKYIWIIGFDN